jgi:hypothetical protein
MVARLRSRTIIRSMLIFFWEYGLAGWRHACGILWPLSTVDLRRVLLVAYRI